MFEEKFCVWLQSLSFQKRDDTMVQCNLHSTHSSVSSFNKIHSCCLVIGRAVFKLQGKPLAIFLEYSKVYINTRSFTGLGSDP